MLIETLFLTPYCHITNAMDATAHFDRRRPSRFNSTNYKIGLFQFGQYSIANALVWLVVWYWCFQKNQYTPNSQMEAILRKWIRCMVCEFSVFVWYLLLEHATCFLKLYLVIVSAVSKCPGFYLGSESCTLWGRLYSLKDPKLDLKVVLQIIAGCRKAYLLTILYE